MNIILETSRLYLRQFIEADAALLRQLNSQPGVLQYIPEPIPASDEEAKEILINIILPQYKNNPGRWATHIIENNEIDLGYRFMPSAWGKGYATELAKATLEYGHQNLQLKKIIAHAHIDNIASQKVLEKIGMQYVGEGIDRGLPVKGYVSFSSNL